MIDPEGQLLAHRFDAVADVKLSAETVEYRDLILDWWAFPDDTLIEEDRDELEDAIERGTIDAKDVERANEAARQVFSRYRHIIDEAVELERKFVRRADIPLYKRSAGNNTAPMFAALRRYLNAILIGFIITFVIYLFVRFDPDKIITGIVISLVGGAVALVLYVFLDKKLSPGEPVLYDKEGNQVDSRGKILKAKSQL